MRPLPRAPLVVATPAAGAAWPATRAGRRRSARTATPRPGRPGQAPRHAHLSLGRSRLAAPPRGRPPGQVSNQHPRIPTPKSEAGRRHRRYVTLPPLRAHNPRLVSTDAHRRVPARPVNESDRQSHVGGEPAATTAIRPAIGRMPSSAGQGETQAPTLPLLGWTEDSVACFAKPTAAVAPDPCAGPTVRTRISERRLAPGANHCRSRGRLRCGASRSHSGASSTPFSRWRAASAGSRNR